MNLLPHNRNIVMLFVLAGLIFAVGCTFATSTNATTSPGKGLSTTHENQKTTPIFQGSVSPRCHLSLMDDQLAKQVSNLLKIEKVVIIKYVLNFVNYTECPLKINNTLKPEIWFRTSSEHGQTLLNLAFNYDVLSMNTLTLGTSKLKIDLIDDPPNCMAQASAKEQLYSIQYLLLRDFDSEASIKLAWKEGICHKMAMDDNGFSSFVHECVSIDAKTSKLVVIRRFGNSWIKFLSNLLIVIRFFALAYIPCILISVIKGLIKQRMPYVVKLQGSSSLQKNIIIINDTDLKEKYISEGKEVLDLDKESGFPKLRSILFHCTYPVNKPCTVKFQQYDILVDYHRTQPEDTVKVGITQTLMDLSFRCKFKEVGPFVLCCQAEMVKHFASNKFFLLWITFWRKVAAILLVIAIPLPYYLRIAIYYWYEHEEVSNRRELTSRMGLQNGFEHSFVHYWTPVHPVFITMYVIYFLTGLIVALAPDKHEDSKPNHVLKRIVNSFRDLDEFSYIRVYSYIFANFSYPFYKHGVFGCVACLFYWALAFPLAIFVCLIYSIPTFYIIIRMIHYCIDAIYIKLKKKQKPILIYQVNKRNNQKKLLDKLKIENIFARSSRQPVVSTSFEKQLGTAGRSRRWADCWSCFTYIVTTLLCILTFGASVFVLADLVVFVVQVIVFTIMGIIVNASYILRHVVVVAIVVIYCLDSFFNLEKKYLKMNKMLFSEVTKRIKNLNSVTNLPSFLQENRGFKSEELSEQAFFENTDSVVPKKHWMINDLVMFMDSEDTPRIPRKLFKEVCSIRVPGVPGPIYRGQLEALRQLAKLMFFVLLVVIAVMIFGEIYSLSSTNQLIATVAGSFLPMIFRSVLFQQSADIEVNTVTFKCHLDELIKSFHQNWPIYDLTFEFTNDEPDTSGEGPEFVIVLPRACSDFGDLGEIVSY